MNLLTADLTKVDTSRPLLAKGPMRFRVASMKIVKSKKSKVDMIETVFVSEFPSDSAPAKDGTVTHLNPGFRIMDNMTVEPTGDLTEEQILKSLARRRAELTGSQAGNFLPLEQYIGKLVDCVVDIQDDETGEYGPQNRLRKMQPAK